MTEMAPAAPLSVSMNRRQKWLLLGSLMVSLFVAALDQSVVATAIPRILADLGGFGLLSWLFTSYMLTSTVVIPLVGKLGDLFGRKMFLIGGVFLFMIASAACGAAPTMESLIAFRFVQGLGGGMIFASVFASLGDVFSPMERGKYVGLFTGTFSLASIVGPTFGGFLTDGPGWRWIFYINIPVSLIAMAAIWYNLPAKRDVKKVRIDWTGAFLLTAASVVFLLALVWAGDRYPWASAQIIGLLAATVIGIALFIMQERRHPEPILPLHLFRNRMFGVGVFGAFQYLGLFVQTALGASATASGVITTPQSAGVLISSILGGQIISRLGRYKWQTVFGTVLIAVAMGLLMTLTADISRWRISIYMVVLGLGFGLVLPTMSLIVQNAVSFQYMGVATSASQFFRQIGSVLGIAVFGAVLANGYDSEFEKRFSEADRAAVGPEIVSALGDPTIQLDAGKFGRITREVTALPDGPAILERAKDGQAESITSAVRLIFLGAFVASVLSIIFALMLKDMPLRRAMGPPQGAPSPAGTTPPAKAPAAPQASGGGGSA
jgi:EmrB/QacA subfamily drug resistance transporter